MDNANIDFERHVVLVAPQVHWNTGNIGRTCLGTGAFLHIIKPLGFSLDNKHVKRAGLDYWNKVNLKVWQNFEIFKNEMNPQENEVALITKNGNRSLWDMPKTERMFLVFGSETHGLPESIISLYNQSTYYIPINKEIRCLNLSTSVGIILYESLRSLNPKHEWS